MRALDDECAVYDPIADTTVLLNLSAATILELCDGRRTQEQIAGELAATCRIPLDTARRDVARALDELEVLSLLMS